MGTPATFGQRAIARCVDMVVLFLLSAGAIAGFVEEQADGTTTFDAPWWWVVLVFVGVLAYETVPVRVRGQTPGKIITHIRIVTVDTGDNPSWRQAFARWVVPAMLLLLSAVLGPIVLPVLAVVYGTALLDREGRSVLDKLAGTRVVQAR